MKYLFKDNPNNSVNFSYDLGERKQTKGFFILKLLSGLIIFSLLLAFVFRGEIFGHNGTQDTRNLGYTPEDCIDPKRDLVYCEFIRYRK